MLDFWNLKKIDECLFFLFKTELKCKAKKDYEYILATARLLPNYGFPVGLNVVDKFAKIPNWMSKTSRKYYATHLLRQAIKNKDQNTVSLAVKILSKKSRSWKNRPIGGISK